MPPPKRKLTAKELRELRKKRPTVLANIDDLLKLFPNRKRKARAEVID